MPKRFDDTLSGKVFRFLKEEVFDKNKIEDISFGYIAKKLGIRKVDIRDAKWWLKAHGMIIDTGPGKLRLNTNICHDKKRCELICGRYYGARCNKEFCPLNHLLVENGNNELYFITFLDEKFKIKNLPRFKAIRKESVVNIKDVRNSHS